MHKKEITEHIKTFYHVDFEMSLEKLAEMFSMLAEGYNRQSYKNTRLMYRYEEGEVVFAVLGERLETTRELNKRLKNELKEREKAKLLRELTKREKEEQDKRDYIRLKKKFAKVGVDV